MIGLLLKDLLALRKQARIVLLLGVFYAIMGMANKDADFIGVFVTLVCVLLPISALAYDEKANWDKYALTMPITRQEMVIEKYLLGIIVGTGAFILNLVINLLTKIETLRAMIDRPVLMLATGILLIAIMLPLMFKYGVEKGRIIIFILFILPSVFAILLPKLGLNAPDEDVLNLLAHCYPLIVLAIFVISILISIRIYKKKEFV